MARVSYKATTTREAEVVFCDYGRYSAQTVELTGCRIKTLLFRQLVACDYAMIIGLLTLNPDQIVEISQLPAPGWYWRQETDAWKLAGALGNLNDELGLGASLTRILSKGGG
jgi:hypothetical protein